MWLGMLGMWPPVCQRCCTTNPGWLPPIMLSHAQDATIYIQGGWHSSFLVVTIFGGWICLKIVNHYMSSAIKGPPAREIWVLQWAGSTSPCILQYLGVILLLPLGGYMYIVLFSYMGCVALEVHGQSLLSMYPITWTSSSCGRHTVSYDRNSPRMHTWMPK